MKKYLTFGYIFLFLTITTMLSLTTRARPQIVRNKKFAVLDISVEDTALLHGTSLEFDINQNCINTDFPGYTVPYTKQLNTKITRMVIPLSNGVVYGRIQLDDIGLKTGGLAKRPLNNDNNLFLFQSGDTVTLHLSEQNGGAYFTGRSADKYNCMYRIGCRNETASQSEYNHLMAIKNYEAALLAWKYAEDSVYNVQLNVLNGYKRKLDPTVFDLIRLDSWSQCNKNVLDMYLGLVFRKRHQEMYKITEDLFLKDYINGDEIFKDTALLTESYKYGDFLTTREKAYAVIINSTVDKNCYNNLKFADINKVINAHYKNDILKDKVKLLAFLNIDRKREADFVNYLNEAVNDAGENVFRIALEEFKAANALGANGFPFELPDQDGKVYTLNDFKGKIVILDFWFTGCGGCLGMAKVLKPIVVAYKSNPNIVFITVSIDDSKKMWQKSLAEEKYSSKDEVNLLAGKETQSPIIKHYNIGSYPTLIAISKDGKIISTAPPDPRVDPSNFNKFLEKNLRVGFGDLEKENP